MGKMSEQINIPPNLRDVFDCSKCLHFEERGDGLWCEEYEYYLGWDSEQVCDEIKIEGAGT